MDPFFGCATTLVAAENAGREWDGIDRNEEAMNQAVSQLEKWNERSEDWLRKVIIRDDVPVPRIGGSCRITRNTLPNFIQNKTAIVPVVASVGTRLFIKSTIKRQNPKRRNRPRRQLANSLIRLQFSKRRAFHHGLAKKRTL